MRAALLDLAEEKGLTAALVALFGAQHVNPSEDRPALHWALRASSPLPGAEAEAVRTSLDAADAFAAKVHAGAPLSSTGAAFATIVHVGIGGSDFGPRLIADSLAALGGTEIELRFCANLDPYDLDSALSGLDPATTLVVGVSKSFGTEETLYNLSRARDWLKAALGEGWTRHMALVTANPERAAKWLEGGDAHVFDLPLSVGGRFSLWSAASLSCACVLGVDALKAFRAGAEEMDEHVRTAPLAENMAAQLALMDFWNTSMLGHSQRVVLAYSRRLRMLPFGFEARLLRLQKILVRAAMAVELRTIQLEHLLARGREEGAIVRDDERGHFFPASHLTFEPLDGLDVEVVGGLVEEKELRLLQ